MSEGKPIDTVATALVTARSVVESCSIDVSDTPPVSINNLADTIQHQYANGADIVINDLEYNAAAPLGRIDRYDDRFLVWVKREQTWCWRRFVACKELCHIILDDKESHTDNIPQLIDDLRSSQFMMPSKSVSSEQFAFFMAIEILMPWKFYKRYDSPPARNYKIATFFRIPEAIVDARRQSGFSKLNDELDQADQEMANCQ